MESCLETLKQFLGFDFQCGLQWLWAAKDGILIQLLFNGNGTPLAGSRWHFEPHREFQRFA